MTSLRSCSFLMIKKSRFLLSSDLYARRTFFLGANAGEWAPRRRGGGTTEKPYAAPIIDLGDQLNQPRKPVLAEPESKPIQHSTSPKVPKEVKHPLPFPFVRLEKNDSRLREVMMIVKSKKYRKEANLIMLEGKRLINDALSAGVRPHCFFFSQASDMADISAPTDDHAVPIYKVVYNELKLWSDLVTCPGVIGIFNTPKPNVLRTPEEAMPLTIILDNVRDPGNLGSILRVAAGVGSSRVILTTGCCDMWDTKVLRSSCGAHFRIPIDTKIEWYDMGKHIDMSHHVFIADNRNEMTAEHEKSASTETSGDGKSASDSDSDSDSEDELEREPSQRAFEATALHDQLSHAAPYFEIDFVKRSPMVLIIGGETHGVSFSALKFARLQASCSRLHIPLFNDVESLNNGIAFSVIAYEIQRQFILSSMSSRSGEPQDGEQISAKGET